MNGSSLLGKGLGAIYNSKTFFNLSLKNVIIKPEKGNIWCDIMKDKEFSSKSQAENGTDNTTIMTPLRVKQSILANSPAAPSQLQSDWNESDSASLAYIKNKPTIPSKTSDLTNDDGFLTDNDFKTINHQSIVGSGDIEVSAASDVVVLEYLDENFKAKMQDAVTNGKGVLLHYPNSITQTLPRGTALGGAIYSGDHTTFVLSNYSRTVLPGGLYSSYIYEFSTPVSYISNTNGEPGYTYYQLKVTDNEANNEITWYEPVQQILEGKIDDLDTIRSGATSGANALQPGDNVSELANDANYVVNETDPVFMLSPAYTITNNNIYNWNAKQEALVSGNNIKTINNQSILGSGDINIKAGATYYFDGQNNQENVNMLNAICDIYDGGAEVNLTGKFADYETGQIFQAPINVVKYTDANDNTTYSFVSDPVVWLDTSQTPAPIYYLTFALYFEGTWGHFTSVSSYRLDTMTPEQWTAKQDALVSGTNIKTINNQSLLGSGNINIQGGGDATDVQVNGTSVTNNHVANLVTQSAYNASTNKLATKNDIPTKTSQLTNNSNFVSDSSYVHTDNNYTSTEKNKLSGIESGAEVNDISTIKVNGTTQTITNKSVNITVPTKTSDLTNTGENGTLKYLEKKETNANLWFIAPTNNNHLYYESGVNKTDITLANLSDIPSTTSQLTNDSNFVSDASYVHTDNNYTTTEKNKLSGIASGAEVNVQSDWNVSDSTSDAFIKNKPTIPTKTSQLTNDSGYVSSSQSTVGSTDRPVYLNNGTLTQTNTPASGNYFKGVPFVTSGGVIEIGRYIDFHPTNDSTLDFSKRIDAGAGTTARTLTLPDKSGTLAITGDIPTVNNGTLTIQKNGTNVQTFTANQSSNVTANITVPTKTSELTNDSGYTSNIGTITGITMNGASKGTSGVVDLGTVLTSHQSLANYVTLNGAQTITGVKTFNANTNFNKNEAQNFALQKLSSAPASPVNGQMYYNTNTGSVYVYANGDWVDVLSTTEPTENYNSLFNKPIINVEGTDTEPIIISTLEKGAYRLLGSYKYNSSDATVSASNGMIIFVFNQDSVTKRIIFSENGLMVGDGAVVDGKFTIKMPIVTTSSVTATSTNISNWKTELVDGVLVEYYGG